MQGSDFIFPPLFLAPGQEKEALRPQPGERRENLSSMPQQNHLHASHKHLQSGQHSSPALLLARIKKRCRHKPPAPSEYTELKPFHLRQVGNHRNNGLAIMPHFRYNIPVCRRLQACIVWSSLKRSAIPCQGRSRGLSWRRTSNFS